MDGKKENISLEDILFDSRYATNRSEANIPNIVYYLTRPEVKNFPIVILCGGSSSKYDIESIAYFHHYFLQDFLDLNIQILRFKNYLKVQ